MKKLIALVGAYTFYQLGDWVSRFVMWDGFGYRVYSKLMEYSMRIQDWGRLDKPWRRHD